MSINEYGGTFTKIFMIMIQGWYELKNNTSRIFHIEFRDGLCPHFTTGSLTDGSMNLGSRNEGFLMVPNFP